MIRLINGELTTVYQPFTEDWNPARRREKAQEIMSGEYLTYCAFDDGRVVGEIMLVPELNKGRLIIDSFHVSADYRRHGLGRRLFEAAKQEALRRGAHALYMSACSSQETIGFYMAMGSRLSPDPIRKYAESEPYDLQLECPIVAD